MPPHLNRRDFIKAAAAFSLLPLTRSRSAVNQDGSKDSPPPNIILIVFDAFSGLHLPMYGYPRQTTHNLDRLAQRATVFHAHHSAASFTTPSTASLFSGVYPWSHRVFTLGGMPKTEYLTKNAWQYLQDIYFEATFVQNLYADVLLLEMQRHMDLHLGPDSFSLAGKTIYDHLFPNDAAYGAKSYDQFLFDPKEKPGSFFLSIPIDLTRQVWKRIITEKLIKDHPDGPPLLVGAETLFTLEQVMDGAKEVVSTLPAPFFAYFHFLPPHTPYRPDRNFLGKFDKGWTPPKSKKHPLSARIARDSLDNRRQEYDEYIANQDSAFGRLLDHLESTGLLETSYLIVTSDHGEFFEKGEQGHVTPLLFEPVIHIPLIISAPGQNEHREVHTLTSNVDLVPTLMKIAGKEVPNYCEGRILPGFEGATDDERSIFASDAKRNSSFKPMNKATIASLRGNYKLIRYIGYRDYEGYEFYDLENDPLEEENLYGHHPAASEMQAEMDERLQQANQPYIVQG